MTSDYFTPGAGTGVRYPRSGQVLAAIADLFRLRADVERECDVKEVASAKTVQRFFTGDRNEKVSIETMQQVVETFFAIAIPADLGVLLDLPEDVRDLALGAARDMLKRYDDVSGELNSRAFPIIDPGLAYIPYVRMAALDGAIRWGAFQWLRAARGQKERATPSWIEPHALRSVIDHYRGARTLEDIAHKCDVSLNALKAWRADDATPERDGNLTELAAVLANVAGASRERVLLDVRLAAGGGALRRFLTARLGDGELGPSLCDDLLDAFATTARITGWWLCRMLDETGNADLNVAQARALVLLGASAPGGEPLCGALGEIAMAAWRKDVALDFGALPGAWFDRLAQWSRELGSVDFALAKVREKDPALASLPLTDEQMRRGALLVLLRMSGFDRPVEGEVIRIKNPPWIAAANRVGQATDAAAMGDYETAIAHARRAVELQPENAHHHFVLGAHLGNLVSRGALHAIDEAIHECRIAYELDRTQPQPLNEIAIILSNARLYTQAEDAYAAVAEACDWWAHHHHGRGLNLIALQRFEDARRCFERALELEPRHVEAKLRLAAVLHRLGDTAGARKWSKAAQRDGHEDPLAAVDRWLTLHLPTGEA